MNRLVYKKQAVEQGKPDQEHALIIMALGDGDQPRLQVKPMEKAKLKVDFVERPPRYTFSLEQTRTRTSSF